MDLEALLSEQKQIIAAVITGAFAILAALIRRDGRSERHVGNKPVWRLMLLPFVYLGLGGGLLAAEIYLFNFLPGEDLSFDNPGAILCLAGCILLVAGVVWWPINVIRLWTWPKTPAPSSVPLASSTPVQGTKSSKGARP